MKRILLVAAIAAAPAVGPASAGAYFFNQNFDSAGAGGAGPITTIGNLFPPPYAGSESAAADWTQFTVYPGGELTTTLLSSTDPFGADANMLHVVTDSGDYPPAKQGNGFGQIYVGGLLLAHATLTFDLDVVSGSVSGGLTAVEGSVGVFPPGFPTWGPTGGWIQVTDTMNAYLSQGVYFETLSDGTTANGDLTKGGDYYIANIGVSSVPEPASWAMMLAGFAGLGLAGWRKRRAAIA